MAALNCHTKNKPLHAQIVKELSMKEITAVIKERADSLLNIHGVVGVYAGRIDDSIPCIRIMIENDDSTLIKKIPATIDGYPVEIEVSGRIEPLKQHHQ